MHPIRRLAPLALVLLLAVGGASADETADAIAEFKKAQKLPEVPARIEAYDALTFYDGPGIVGPMLDAMGEDPHPGVVVGGTERLARLVSGDAKEELVSEATKGKPERRFLALLALRRQQGRDGHEVLLSIAAGNDPMLACQAMLALGAKQIHESVPMLLERAASAPDWQLRRASIEALRVLAGPAPQPRYDKEGVLIPEEEPPPWLPAWYPLDKVAPVLIAALARPDGGVERREARHALVRLYKSDMGFDAKAWAALAAGAAPETLEPKDPPLRRFVGIPLFGSRCAVVVDHSAQTDDPLLFDRERLTALCEVPGARPIPWFQIKTKRDFYHAWVRRWISDLDKDLRFEVILTKNALVPAFGRWSSVHAGTKKRALELLEKTMPETGQDVLGAIEMAINLGGDKDAVAWKKGPEEIVYIGSTVPWLAPVTDQEHIGAALYLRSTRLQIPIHTIGVGPHPLAMLTRIAEGAHAEYVDLQK